MMKKNVRHQPRVAANPIPYWATAGKTREVFDRAFANYQQIGFHRGESRCAGGDERRGVSRLDRGLRPHPLA